MLQPNWSAIEKDCDTDDVRKIVDYAKVRERQHIIATEFIQQAADGEEIDWVLAMEIINAEEFIADAKETHDKFYKWVRGKIDNTPEGQLPF